MSLEALRVKEEPACALTHHVTIKDEPELYEAEWVQNEAEYESQLCVQQELCVQLEPACTKREPLCAPPEEVCGLEPVYTELETVCFKAEPVCVKEEPLWQDSVLSELGQDLKYEIRLEPGPPPAETPNANRVNWDCFVRLERCVVPRGAALRLERAAPRRERAPTSRPSARHETLSPHLSRAHKKELARMKFSGSLIKRIDKIENSFACEICNRQYTSLCYLLRHKLSHTKKTRSNLIGSDKNAYFCEICKKQYKSLACLRTHKLKHTKKTRSKAGSVKNTYFCEICKGVFHELDSLKVHALVHAQMTSLFHICDICHREFSALHALRAHKRALHEHVRPFWCNICKQRFSRPNDLSRHLAAHRAQTHKGKLTTYCKGCETTRALKQLSDLLQSDRGQTSAYTDFCELCNNFV